LRQEFVGPIELAGFKSRSHCMLDLGDFRRVIRVWHGPSEPILVAADELDIGRAI
jgi:hypothetical protein